VGTAGNEAHSDFVRDQKRQEKQQTVQRLPGEGPVVVLLVFRKLLFVLIHTALYFILGGGR
jgi:hypothetical protein